MSNYRYISPSEIASMDCWRAYRWKREGIKPRQQPKPLNIGIAWDAFMSEWFRPIGQFGDMLTDTRGRLQRYDAGLKAANAKINAAAKQADAAFIAQYGEGSMEVESERLEIATLIDGMATHFAETFQDSEHGTCRAAQFRVDAPLPSQSGKGISNLYRLGGYIDRIMERDGELVIVDDKTAGAIGDSFFDDFQNDLQMPLYAYGMKQMGFDVGSIAVFASAKKIPAFPEMRKTPFPVYEKDANGDIVMQMVEGEMKPVNLMEPVIDEATGAYAVFKSGPRKGEIKTARVTREGLASMLSGDGSLNYTTTSQRFLESIAHHELDKADYTRELEYLEQQGVKPFFQLAELNVSPAMMQESAEVLRAVAPLLDKVPDAPMRNKFRCSRCVYQEACVITDMDSRNEAIKTLYSTREERAAMEDKA